MGHISYIHGINCTKKDLLICHVETTGHSAQMECLAIYIAHRYMNILPYDVFPKKKTLASLALTQQGRNPPSPPCLTNVTIVVLTRL